MAVTVLDAYYYLCTNINMGAIAALNVWRSHRTLVYFYLNKLLQFNRLFAEHSTDDSYSQQPHRCDNHNLVKYC